MASIRQLKLKDGTLVWEVRVRTPRGPKACKRLHSLDEAKRFAELSEEKLAVAIPIARQTEEANLASFKNEKLIDTLSHFLKGNAARPRHVGLAPTLSRHIGDTLIGDVTQSWLRRFVSLMQRQTSQLGRPYKFSTIVAHLHFISRVIRWRARDFDVKPPRVSLPDDDFPDNWNAGRKRVLREGEEEMLMARLKLIKTKSNSHWQLFVRFALETGARMTEMSNATWDEFHLDRCLWIIPAERSKTREERAVPMSIKAMHILRILKRLEARDESRLFHKLGKRSNSLSVCFTRYARQAGLDDFCFHDLRHSAITRMVLYKRKLSVYEIMKIVGHTSIEMLDLYTNLRGDELVSRME